MAKARALYTNNPGFLQPLGTVFFMDSTAINYQSAIFMTSAPSIRQCPEDSGCEVAFAGRSNAGKSSAINTLTRNGRLARTSKTPGRTQLINFFQLAECGRLVDLPGYGYANEVTTGKEKRRPGGTAVPCSDGGARCLGDKVAGLCLLSPKRVGVCLIVGIVSGVRLWLPSACL